MIFSAGSLRAPFVGARLLVGKCIYRKLMQLGKTVAGEGIEIAPLWIPAK